MKKLIAGVATASALSLGALSLAGTAPASAEYGPTPPTTSVAAHVIKVLHKKGHISEKKAEKLLKKIKEAKKAGLISKKKAKKLKKKLKKHTKHHHSK